MKLVCFYEDLFKECQKYESNLCNYHVTSDCPMHLIEKYGGWRNRRALTFTQISVAPFLPVTRVCWHHNLQRNQYDFCMPLLGAGICFEEGENQEQIKYQAAHHELVASALATKIAHEIDPENKVGRRWRRAMLLKRRTKTNQDSLCLVVTVGWRS